MKLSSPIRAAAVVLFLGSITLAQGLTDTIGPSLGEVAREKREVKTGTARKVYTNEDLPQSGGISVVGVKADASAASASGGTGDPATKDRNWHQLLAAQKAIIAQLEQQLAVAEENQRLSTHRYTVGANPRYEKFTEQVESLKQRVEQAHQQLEQLQDAAHKAGANQAYD